MVWFNRLVLLALHFILRFGVVVSFIRWGLVWWSFVGGLVCYLCSLGVWSFRLARYGTVGCLHVLSCWVVCICCLLVAVLDSAWGGLRVLSCWIDWCCLCRWVICVIACVLCIACVCFGLIG